jgi:outer membrane protein OmpA-like peptidoglycan-associated protein
MKMIAVRPNTWMVGAALAAAFAVTGCATEKYVNTHVAAVDEKITNTQSTADQQKARIAEHDQMLARLDKTSREAYERAEAAGKLAEGKFLYNVTLQDDGYKFKTNKYALSDDEKSKLMDFANKLKTDNRNVYIEIQGHTDSTGTADYNQTLGEERAEAVRLFLNEQGVALNRMNTISYGETAPVADNKSKAGRAQNRRVNIVVMA